METIFSTALFVDTKSRDLAVSMVSVTQIETGKLVLRFGAEIGKLAEVHRSFYGDFPIIVSTQGYEARSSAGFVRVLASWPHACAGHSAKAEVVGVCGFPWMNRPALRTLRKPMSVIVFRPRSQVKQVATHSNLNAATAEAAIKGIEMVSYVRQESVFLLEGQSNCCVGWEVAFHNYTGKPLEDFEPAFEQEHNLRSLGLEPEPQPLPQRRSFVILNDEDEEDDDFPLVRVRFDDDEDDDDILSSSTIGRLRGSKLEFVISEEED